MSKYRLRSDGSLKSQGELRRLNPSVSLPRVWKQPVFDLLQIDPVLASPKPTTEEFELIVLDGAVQDSNGNWVENWAKQPMFSSTEDELAYRIQENSKLVESKKTEIRIAAEEAYELPVQYSSDVFFNGGMDSALAIDGAVRMVENAGGNSITLFDTNNKPNVVTIAQGKIIAALVGAQYQEYFARKQGLFVELGAIDLASSDAKTTIESISF